MSTAHAAGLPDANHPATLGPMDFTQSPQPPQQIELRLRHLEVMERVTQISLSSDSVEELLQRVLDEVLTTFQADRAWVLFPCDPDAASWSVPMERTVPQWPGAFARGGVIPMIAEMSDMFRALLDSPAPQCFGPGNPLNNPPSVTREFSVQSQIQMALRPRVGAAWCWGLHHCAQAVAYTPSDVLIFKAIGERVTDALSVLITLKNLREVSARLERLMAASPTILFSLRVQDRHVVSQWASDNQNRILGFPQDQTYQPKWWGEHVHQDDRARAQAEISKVFDGEAVSCDYRFRRQDGRVVWIQDERQLICDAAGQPIEVLGCWTDVTERKHAEQTLRVAATAFESQEGMLITDAAKTVVRVNKSYCDITGYAPEEVIGQTPLLLDCGCHTSTFFDALWAQVAQTGTWQGEIWSRRKNGEVFPVWLTLTAVTIDGGDIANYVGTFLDITQRKAAAAEIDYLAFHDPLTKLANRRLLHDRLRQAMAASVRNKRHGAVLLIDLDDFKTINDTLGHDIGDHLLQEVATRLSACVRDGDSVARLGGDEFVVVVEGLSENLRDAAAQAEAIGEKLVTALRHPYEIANSERHSTPSVGVALFCDHDSSVDDLMKQADLAMYQAKAAGRNRLRFFDPQMQAVVSARAALEVDLRRGLRCEEFLLHYQPQVNAGGSVTGVEALLRWQHHERGLVAPAEFIALAEATDLILPLGRWVLETACRQLVRWTHEKGMGNLSMAVNVSARQFRHDSFVDMVTEVLRATGADPRLLKLELTESVLVDDVEDVARKMTALKSVGVSFSLDDFGTGYSSLSYLKRLPLDQLKIDRSFVRDVLDDANDAAIARAIVTLAASLGLTVIAEGVETEAQRSFLASAGCHAYQGYLFGRPGPL